MLLEEHGADLPLDEAAACLAAEEQDGLDPQAVIAAIDQLGGTLLQIMNIRKSA